jgi:hypothetical protein
VAVAIRSGLPPRYVWYEVVFDGNHDLADQIGKKLGIDFDAALVTAEQRAAEANLAMRGKNTPKPDDSEPPVPSESAEREMDRLAERGSLVRAVNEATIGVQAGNSGAVVTNSRVSG